MQELMSQLARLYLPPGPMPDGLERHLDGQSRRGFDLARDGAVRAIVVPFDIRADADGSGQWERLCALANALHGELGLPAPAVSVSGGAGYRLWISFEAPVAAGEAQRFLDLLRAAYCPDVVLPAGGVLAPVELPPCRNPASGKWAAFIHPGMGASFADEPALDMPPPLAAQAAFLEGLHSITRAQFRQALEALQRLREPQPQPQPHQAAPEAAALPHGLLLKDATIDDIVRFLHAKNIEPTFRHLLPPR